MPVIARQNLQPRRSAERSYHYRVLLERLEEEHLEIAWATPIDVPHVKREADL